MRDGYFHADLHQGNLLVQDDGTIVAIDFGIMGRLSKNDRRFLAEILFGFISRDYKRVAEIHFDAGYVPYNQSVEEFAQAMRVIADPIMDLPVEKISAGKLLAQLFATTERFSMRTQPQLLLLQRSMVMAEGLALHLNPQTNMWEISRPVIEDWMYDNLSPEIRIADAIVQIPRIIERMPMKLDQLLNKQLDDQGQNTYQPRPQSLSAFALGLIVGAIIVKILFL
jgi:ubiquinone biosynthesis protein